LAWPADKTVGRLIRSPSLLAAATMQQSRRCAMPSATVASRRRQQASHGSDDLDRRRIHTEATSVANGAGSRCCRGGLHRKQRGSPSCHRMRITCCIGYHSLRPSAPAISGCWHQVTDAPEHHRRQVNCLLMMCVAPRCVRALICHFSDITPQDGYLTTWSWG
jgi:hypothetical protein